MLAGTKLDPVTRRQRHRSAFTSAGSVLRRSADARSEVARLSAMASSSPACSAVRGRRCRRRDVKPLFSGSDGGVPSVANDCAAKARAPIPGPSAGVAPAVARTAAATGRHVAGGNAR